VIESIEKELKKVRKRFYFRILDFVKIHPVWALVLSSLFAIFLGTVGSLIAALIWNAAGPPGK
jgi:hypothetical protein